MTQQIIPLKKEFKAYQILALCYHFYNQGMYPHEIDRYYSPPNMTFKKIGSLFNSSFSKVGFEHVLNDHFMFTFDNYKQIYHNSYQSYKNFAKAKVLLKYGDNTLDSSVKFPERYNIDEKPIEAYLKRTYHFKDSDNIIEENELQKYYKMQEETINKLRFYEENCLDIVKVLTNTNYKLYSSRSSSLTLDFMYGFRKYAKCINSYMKKGIQNKESISNIFKAFAEDMQPKTIYNFKALKFQKQSDDSLYIYINKSFIASFYINERFINSIMSDTSDGIFDVIIPMFEEIGGYKELQNVILHNRILTE